MYLAPPLGVTQSEFHRDDWGQKTNVPGLSYSVVCVILRLAVLVKYRRATVGHMTTAYTVLA